MATMKKPPTANAGAPIVLAKCQICGVPGLPAPGGVCSACATAMGMPGVHKCPQCGSSYSTTDAACPACMVKMMQIMFRTTVAPPSSASITHFPRQEPEPLPRADMQVRDLIGWRVWRITSLGYLRSLTADAIWLPGVPMEADGVVDTAMTPGGSPRSLGIHVFAERNGAILEVETYDRMEGSNNHSYAIGSVLLWGEVVEHERGYRAERAKIKSIDDVTWHGKPPWDKETAEVLGFLRARYGVQVPRGTKTKGASHGAE